MGKDVLVNILCFIISACLNIKWVYHMLRGIMPQINLENKKKKTELKKALKYLFITIVYIIIINKLV
ncbi:MULTISPECIES: hypothetical protein [unclassified Clostridium]|uniref:hypothetical protein n=1 Tax=unclassified Clostridium TaxID=2614128 RepID=UPI003217AD29